MYSLFETDFGQWIEVVCQGGAHDLVLENDLKSGLYE